MGTCVGTIISVDGEKQTCAIEESKGAVGTFRLDDNATLVFRGMRPLRIDELRPGMYVEIDHRRMTEEGLPIVTWVEVLEQKRK